jgi:hypothetical protein
VKIPVGSHLHASSPAPASCTRRRPFGRSLAPATALPSRLGCARFPGRSYARSSSRGPSRRGSVASTAASAKHRIRPGQRGGRRRRLGRRASAPASEQAACARPRPSFSGAGASAGAVRSRQQEQGEIRPSLSASVRLASRQRLSVSPVMRQSAVTARRIEASARHGLAQRFASEADPALPGEGLDEGNLGEDSGLGGSIGGGGAGSASDGREVSAEPGPGGAPGATPANRSRAREIWSCASSTLVGSGSTASCDAGAFASGAPPPQAASDIIAPPTRASAREREGSAFMKDLRGTARRAPFPRQCRSTRGGTGRRRRGAADAERPSRCRPYTAP